MAFALFARFRQRHRHRRGATVFFGLVAVAVVALYLVATRLSAADGLGLGLGLGLNSPTGKQRPGVAPEDPAVMTSRLPSEKDPSPNQHHQGSHDGGSDSDSDSDRSNDKITNPNGPADDYCAATTPSLFHVQPQTPFVAVTQVPLPSAAPSDYQYSQPSGDIDNFQDQQRPIMATDEAEGDSATATRQQPIVIGDLPARFIPSAPPAPGKDDGGKTGTGKKKKKKKEKKQKQKQPTTKRLIIVGDVHGQLATLRALLTKLDFDHPRFSPDDRHTANAEADTAETSSGSDHLVLVGDIVTKGPDSAGVVQLAMDLGASAVRGNHDENVLRAAGRISSLQATAEGQEEADEGGDEGGEAVDSVLAKKKAKAANEHARAVARTLSKAQLNWLAALPIALRISGGLPGAATPPWNARTIVVVHAGLVPSVALEKQDRWAVMNMRSLVYHPRRPHHHLSSVEAEAAAASEAVREEARHKKKKKPAAVVPVDGREGEPWSHAWNRAQNAIKTEQDRVVVVYGHDAKAGLQADLEVDISAAEAALPTDYNSDDEGSGMEDDDDDDDAAAAAAADSAGASASKKKSNKQNNKKKKAPHKHAKGIRYAFGLDSGCGHGRQLSALVIEAVAATAGPEGDGEGARITHHIVQVDCGGGEGK